MSESVSAYGDHVAFFESHESEVRSYCRRLPALLASATGAVIVDERGRSYIDFMSACGALNYGHNHPKLKAAALNHIQRDGIAAALDFHTTEKYHFLESFYDRILTPRNLNYKVQFPGPTGANCVEAALKLARKATGRETVVAFTNAFHGVSLGALSATASSAVRKSGRGALNNVVRLPYDGYHGAGVDDLFRFRAMVTDPSGGIDPPAAFVVETVQGEGGLNVASEGWLIALADVARDLSALLIVDDIQAGCGRAGSFFSFERAGIVPDLVCLAKSISGYGFPMSLLLVGPQFDVWSPGEHNGTFRGNSLAFVTAHAALELWDSGFGKAIDDRSALLGDWCRSLQQEFPDQLRSKGLGMMRGLEFVQPDRAIAAAELATQRRIVIECCGPQDEVLKIMAPINIDLDLFGTTLGRLADIVRTVLRPQQSSIEKLERNEAGFDSHDDRGYAIPRPQFSHCVADMKFDGLLRN